VSICDFQRASSGIATAAASPDDGGAGVGVGAGAGVAEGFDGTGVGDMDGSLGEVGPDDDVWLDVDVPDVDVLDVDVDPDVDEAPPVVLVGSALDVLSAPCEKVPWLRVWSRSSSSA